MESVHPFLDEAFHPALCEIPLGDALMGDSNLGGSNSIRFDTEKECWLHFLSINSIMEKVGLGKFSGLCLLDRLTFETQENLHSKELLNTQKHIVKNIRRYRRGCQAHGSQGSSTTSSSPDEPFQFPGF